MLTGNSVQIIETVAASAPNHCIDGWSYAARALAALLSGDCHASRHLAYYAQLRAGLCLLANLGVGIFNRTNFVISATGAILRLDKAAAGKPNSPGMGTHQIVWAALKDWSADATTARIFLELIKIRGVSLKDCLDAIWPGMPATIATGSLIEAWGLDLQRGKDEHAFRNISSYAPQSMNPLLPVAPGGLAFVVKFWEFFEPTSGASFDNLDRYLLRSILLRQHVAVTSNNSYDAGAIAANFDRLPTRIQTLASKNFLTNATDPGLPSLLTSAGSTASPAQPIEMLSRAFMLLRAATGFTYSSLTEAGINCSTGELRAWIDPWAASRGFWEPQNPLPEPADLWLDIEIALDDFKASMLSPPSSLKEWMSFTSKGLPTIHEAERIGVWSFCS